MPNSRTSVPESGTVLFPARLKDLNKQLEKNIADAAKFTEKTKPGKIENNKQEHKRLKEEIDFLQEKVDAGRSRVESVM